MFPISLISWTHEGWLYLTVMIDLFSRKVVGWDMSSRMKADVVCNALTMATWRRRPEAGLIVHSDRGSQYASNQYRSLLFGVTRQLWISALFNLVVFMEGFRGLIA